MTVGRALGAVAIVGCFLVAGALGVVIAVADAIHRHV